ncbi:MAG: tRNA 2-thiouridine(34) synthase MnmA [Chloroflexota bacterium]
MVKVIVGLSGGVDSAVAAALLVRQGYQVSGVTMWIWDGKDSPTISRRHSCYGPGEEEDIEDAHHVADILDIPFHVIDLRQEYKTDVLDYFFHEYQCGRTPNPCVRCNHRVKFDALLRKMQESGVAFDYFATGHYAIIEHNGHHLLKKAKDVLKDQTYFLSALTQEQLGLSLFPIGEYTKTEVRKLAADFNLSVSEKPDSQDFVAGGYASLLGTPSSGAILDRQGKVLGEHRGLPFYTIGQRKGLNISAREPLYVIDIDPSRNAVIVGNKMETYHDELIASELNWIAIEALKEPMKVSAKIRAAHREAAATIVPLRKDNVYVKFDEPQMAITPGQRAVFYQEDIVIGGGTIEKVKE